MGRERGPERLRPPRPDGRAVHRREEPLVRVDDDRVGVLDAVEAPAELGADGGRARVGRVDVEPDARLGAAPGELRRPGRPRSTRSCRPSPRPRSRPSSGKSVRHPELVVDRDACAARARGSAPPSRPRSAPAPRRRPPRPGRSARAAASAARVEVEAVSSMWPCSPGGQPEQLGEPADDDLLELGRRGRGHPRHRVDVERGGQQLGEDPRLRAGVGEVGEEARVVPVREPRHDQTRRGRRAPPRTAPAPPARSAGSCAATSPGRDRRRRPAARPRPRGRRRPTRRPRRGRRGSSAPPRPPAAAVGGDALTPTGRRLRSARPAPSCAC